MPKTASGLLFGLIFGAILGFIVGHIVWFVYGQIQLLTGTYYPYAALFGPPLYYQIGWTIFGALGLVFKKN